jgi:hypothetical protein
MSFRSSGPSGVLAMVQIVAAVNGIRAACIGSGMELPG